MSLSNRRTFIAKLIGYFVLVGAAILTMIPLLWLVTSSFKTASEIFAVPLKWFPEFPPNVKASPYIDQDAYPPIKKPEALHQRGWEKLQPQISSLIWEEAQKYIAASDRMRSYDRALNVELQAEMVQGIWKQLIVGLSDRVWSGSTTEILSTIRSAIIPEAIDGIWDSLYREVALGSIQIQDMDFNQISLGKPKWSREVEDVTSVREYPGANNGTGFSHHFDGQNKVRIVTSIQSPLPIDRMRAIHLRVRGDASYHHLRLTIEAGDVVYRSREPFVLNDSLWGHSIWRIHGAPSQLESDHIAMIREVKANRIGGATDASEGSELAPLEPSNTLRLRLEIYRPPYLAICWDKFTYNYRHLWEAVPYNRYFINSVFISTASTLLTLFFCSLAGYAFSKYRFRGQKILFGIMLASMMIPFQVLLVPLFGMIYHSLAR